MMSTSFTLTFLLAASLRPSCMAQSINSNTTANWLYSTCPANNICSQRSSVCFKGKCLCRPGLFFAKHDETCSSLCYPADLQGDYTEYPDSRIWRVNMVGQNGLTLQKCKNMCTAATDCLSFDFRGDIGRCVVHDITSQEASSGWYPKISEGWTHYQRTCLKNVDTYPETCVDRQKIDARSGVYFMPIVNNSKPQKVWCDMDMRDGGWLVFQRRHDGDVDFYRNWTEYENGFGNVRGDYWLGLAKLHKITTSRPHRLRVELEDFTQGVMCAEYSSFRVDGPETNYRLHVSGYTRGLSRCKDARDGMAEYNGQRFSTYDNEQNDKCAQRTHSAWWFNWCTRETLNGYYGSYITSFGLYGKVRVSVMKIKPD